MVGRYLPFSTYPRFLFIFLGWNSYIGNTSQPGPFHFQNDTATVSLLGGKFWGRSEKEIRIRSRSCIFPPLKPWSLNETASFDPCGKDYRENDDESISRHRVKFPQQLYRSIFCVWVWFVLFCMVAVLYLRFGWFETTIRPFYVANMASAQD